MTPISAVIITFNEERNIARCIDSLQGVADEIVIVDSFSTDRTEEIAKQRQVKFVSHAFDGYIEQKNWALAQASHPHVLSLDADEALSEELKKAILEAKNSGLKEGYRMKRMTSYCGQWIRHCGWYPDIKLRLFDTRVGAWGGQNPHDVYILKSDGKTELLSGDLLHYSFHTIDQHVETSNKFSSIKAHNMFEKGRKVNVFQLLIYPGFRFFRDYIIKQGFRDGFYGFVVCKISAHTVFLKLVKLRDMNRQGIGNEQ